MYEVLQLTLEDMIVDIKMIRKHHHNYMTHIASTVEIWTTILEDYPEMTGHILKDMKHLSSMIREITGVSHETKKLH